MHKTPIKPLIIDISWHEDPVRRSDMAANQGVEDL